MMFTRFEALLKQRMGLDVMSIGPAMIERAVREGLAASGARDLDAYWKQLQQGAALQQLIESVIVPETWFFRDPEAFHALARLALQQSAHTPQRSLRLLSLPCSTGEEPYSIAMALLDAGLPAARFQIDAVDISTRSLAAANRAIYGRNSFRGKLLDFRARHFTPSAEGHVLSEAVRRQVRFQNGNLFAPGFLSGAAPYDFVFCRNLLIYFDRAMQEQALKLLGKVLNDTGVLFVGPAESGLLVSQNMVSARIPLAFAFRKAASPAAAMPVGASPVPRAPKPLPMTALPAPVRLPAKCMRAVPDAFPTRIPATTDSSASTGLESDAFAYATRLANQGQLAEASAICLRHMQQNSPTAAGYYLLGLVSDAGGKPAVAREHYRKALYLQPDHQEALAQLAALLEMQGDRAAAQRMNDRARRAQLKHQE
jgi:chemotaxis protein methyltransferase WspC